jgi:type I restriction enzyme S subunit
MYSLSSNTNINKAFLISRSDIESRIDPYFFSGEYNTLRKKLFSLNFIKIKSVLKSWNRGDGPRDGYYTEDKDKGVYFLRVNNLKNNTIVLDDVKYIHRHIHNTKLKRTQVKGGDLIFAISGTKDNLGTVSIIPEFIQEANLNSALVRLDLETNKINNEFFCILFSLPFIRTQIEFIGKGAAQNNLNNDEISSILIPDISIESQNKLVLFYKSQVDLQKKKLSESKAFLNSIESYLLNELGIELPIKDKSYSNRTFKINWSEISGDRFDAFSFYNNAIKIEGGVYYNKKLRELATVNKGQSITSSNVIEGQYPVIAGGKSSPYSHNVFNFEGKTITVSASGAYSGYVWYHNEPIFASDCAVIKSKDENEITMDYLSEILKLKQTEIYGLQQGAGQPHVYPSDLIKLNIPLPPIDIQERMTTHIFELREKAKQLETEAKEVLDNAKKEIEKMIIG